MTPDLPTAGGGDEMMGSTSRATGEVRRAAAKASSVLARTRELERAGPFPVDWSRNSLDPELNACSGVFAAEDFFLVLIELQ